MRDIDARKQEMLSLSTLATACRNDSGLGDLAQFSRCRTAPVVLAHSQTSTVGFPQQLSLFYAGKVAPHVGAMIQLTYANASGTIGIDNTDLRYANLSVLPHDSA